MFNSLRDKFYEKDEDVKSERVPFPNATIGFEESNFGDIGMNNNRGGDDAWHSSISS